MFKKQCACFFFLVQFYAIVFVDVSVFFFKLKLDTKAASALHPATVIVLFSSQQ